MRLEINLIAVLTVVVVFIVGVINALPVPVHDGKYKPKKNEGRYVPSNEGKYRKMHWPYMHIHDNRELGKYVHVHIPYDGGFGPYSGFNIPYDHDDSGIYRVSSENDRYPFNNDIYDIPRPQIPLEYGFPDVQSSSSSSLSSPTFVSSRSLSSEPHESFVERSSIIDNHIDFDTISTSSTTTTISTPENPITTPNKAITTTTTASTTTTAPTTSSTISTVNQSSSSEMPLSDDSLDSISTVNKSSSSSSSSEEPLLSDSLDSIQAQILLPPNHDTTTTTTPRPTTTTTRRPTKPYNDEGKWKILRQEELKRPQKYDYLYLTENGIYAEEQAKLRKSHGTSAQGYYEYIGDDDKVYRVMYSTGEQGFIATGDHIPTPPPVPKEIQKALAYVAAKKHQKQIANVLAMQQNRQYQPIFPVAAQLGTDQPDDLPQPYMHDDDSVSSVMIADDNDLSSSAVAIVDDNSNVNESSIENDNVPIDSPVPDPNLSENYESK